jgi:hypothetical protein
LKIHILTLNSLLALLLFVAGVVAQDKKVDPATDNPKPPTPVRQDNPAKNISEITTLTGKTISGKIESISDDGTIRGQGIDSVKIGDVLSITSGVKEKKPTVKIIVRLASGGQIHASKVAVEDGNVRLVTAMGEIDIPVGSVRAILFTPFETGDKITNTIKNPKSDNDQVVAGKDGQLRVVAGLVESVNDEKVKFNYRGKSQTIDRSIVKVIVMADLKEKQSAGTLGTAKLSDTSTIVGSIKKLENGKLTIGLLSDAIITVPWDSVVGINIRSDRLVYLSDLDPAESDLTPIVTQKKELARDTSVDGEKITLYWPSTKKSRTFARGLGTHSYCRLVYVNDGYQRFAAVCGIDAETERNGDCKVIIRGDGIELWSKQVVATADPHNIDLDIDGYREIEIIVEPGKHLDMADHVDFADARFLKTK